MTGIMWLIKYYLTLKERCLIPKYKLFEDRDHVLESAPTSPNVYTQSVKKQIFNYGNENEIEIIMNDSFS